MRFEMYRALTVAGMRWRWRLKARNHEIIAHGESYRDKDDCREAIELVQGSVHAPVQVLP